MMSDLHTGTGSALAQPMSKTAYVVARLRDDIGSGRLSGGTPLLQASIAARYGVSPTPVREALRILEADGIIEYSDHFGASVREITPDEMGDFYRLRAVIEGLAAEIAVERISPENIEDLEQLHTSIAQFADSEALDVDTLANMNRTLHFALYSLGSEVITRQIKNLWTFVPPRITLWRDPEVASELIDGHEQIMAAVRRGDSVAAGALTREHVLHAGALRMAATRRKVTEVTDVSA